MKRVVRLVVVEGEDEWVDGTIARSLKNGIFNLPHPNRIITYQLGGPNDPGLESIFSKMIELLDAAGIEQFEVHDGDTHVQFHNDPEARPPNRGKFTV